MEIGLKIYLMLVLLIFATIVAGADVKVGDNVVITVDQSISDMTSDVRAEKANRAINDLVVNPDFNPDSLSILQSDGNFSIGASGREIISVSASDTLGSGKKTEELATFWLEQIKSGMKAARQQSISPENIIKFSILILYPVFLVLIFVLLQKLTKGFSKFVMRQEGKLVKGLRFGRLEILKPAQEIKIILQITIVLKYVIFAIIFYSTLLVFLGQFDQTSSFVMFLGNKTVEYGKIVVNAMKNIFMVILGAVLLYIAMRLLLFLLNYFMKHYREVPGAQKNLSESAYNAIINALRRVVMVLFFLSVIYIIPGAENLAFALFLIFVVIIGLSLVSLIPDLFAGYVLMVKGIYQKGDRIKADELTGRVKERNFLFTVLETGDGAEAILHNSLILSRPIIVLEKSEVAEYEEE